MCRYGCQTQVGLRGAHARTTVTCNHANGSSTLIASVVAAKTKMGTELTAASCAKSMLRVAFTPELAWQHMHSRLQAYASTEFKMPIHIRLTDQPIQTIFSSPPTADVRSIVSSSSPSLVSRTLMKISTKTSSIDPVNRPQ